MTDFVHLHVHSHYTLLESTNTIKSIVSQAKDLGMPAVAVTDRANLFGALEFFEAAKSAEIQAIIGCQVNVAPLGMTEKARDMHQLVLLAMSEKGYFNLCKLVSRGWLEGFYYEARVDLECIAEHCEDLICLTGSGEYGYLNRHLGVGAAEEADRQAEQLREVFGDRLYIEVTDHKDEGPVSLREANIELSKRLDLPLVATNWVHYLTREHAESHDVQLAVQKTTTLDDPRRRRMSSQEYYIKSADEMAELFADVPEAISNTLVIAERCKGCNIPTGEYHLPVFDCPDDKDPNDYLRELCEAGVRKRYAEITEEIQERLDFELQTILNMGFAAYFLIVSDFIMWAKNQDIPVGPGRGSAAGSIVAYALGITDICPLRYGLLFERFLNPDRVSMPDIDIDFCKDRRGEVIQYTSDKYGKDAVTQIMTLGTMKARMAIKDVSRAYSWTPDEAQQLANLVPEDPMGKHTIPVCLGIKPMKNGEYDTSEMMAKRYQTDERTHQVLDTAMDLENLGRSLGVHACGVIIAPGPVSDYIPVCAVKGKAATQYNMVQCEDCGLLKMDFLGLKTMSILKKAADIIKASSGTTIDFTQVPMDDKKTFELLGQGDTLGVFQCESTGFQQLIKQLKPDRFEDMIALVALYRPGPLQNNMHIDYCNRKHGIEEVQYPHAVLENILKETFGLYIYQEQIMNISRELCGFTPGEADNLRKAMGKKKIDVLNKMKERFINGAWELHQFPKEDCEKMWESIVAFASYCFNKSHSACYGLIAYWTAYLKANFFPEFMTANLIYEMGNKEKMTMFTRELQSRGIDVLPPDINESGWEFTWTGKAVRFGFGGVKGVGHGAAEHVIELRHADGHYDSLYNVCERIDTRKCNKRVIDHLIKVGAFDSIHDNRNAMHSAIDHAFERGVRLAKNKAQSQTTLFSEFESDDEFREQTQGYPDIPEWEQDEKLGYEKQLTGYWMSSHPLQQHQEFFSKFSTHNSDDLHKKPSGQVAVPAVVISKRVVKTRTGKMMAILSLEDELGPFEAVLFAGRPNRRGVMEPGAFDKFHHECEENLVALFVGKMSNRDRGNAQRSNNMTDEDGNPNEDGEIQEEEPDFLPSIIVDDMIPVELATERLCVEICLHLDAEQVDKKQIMATENLLREYPGACPVRAMMQTPHDVLFTLELGDRWTVHPNAEVVEQLRKIWGHDRVKTSMKQFNMAEMLEPAFA